MLVPIRLIVHKNLCLWFQKTGWQSTIHDVPKAQLSMGEDPGDYEESTFPSSVTNGRSDANATLVHFPNNILVAAVNPPVKTYPYNAEELGNLYDFDKVETNDVRFRDVKRINFMNEPQSEDFYPGQNSANVSKINPLLVHLKPLGEVAVKDTGSPVVITRLHFNDTFEPSDSLLEMQLNRPTNHTFDQPRPAGESDHTM